MTHQPASLPQTARQEAALLCVVRPVTLQDLNALQKFAMLSSIGITNLPKERQLLIKKIELSLESFAKKENTPGFDEYTLVLEDIKSGVLVGTCGIKSMTGGIHPLYFYKIETDTSKGTEIRYLKAVKYEEGPSEICSLYLDPQFRQAGLGRLLSLSRLVFIANFSQRFEKIIFAEMRGVIDKSLVSPFWNGVGRHFYHIEFTKIFEMQYHNWEQIPEFLPKYPIYLTFLAPDAQDVIGVPHPHSKPALALLEKEGFSFTQEIDILDGGPRISAKKNEIRTIKQSVLATIIDVDNIYQESELMILANTEIDFRCCYGKIEITKTDQVIIPTEIASALNLKRGQKIRYVSAR